MLKEVHIGYGGLKVSIKDNVRIPCMLVVPLLKTGVVVKECPVWWEEEVLFDHIEFERQVEIWVERFFF